MRTQSLQLNFHRTNVILNCEPSTESDHLSPPKCLSLLQNISFTYVQQQQQQLSLSRLLYTSWSLFDTPTESQPNEFTLAFNLLFARPNEDESEFRLVFMHFVDAMRFGWWKKNIFRNCLPSKNEIYRFTVFFLSGPEQHLTSVTSVHLSSLLTTFPWYPVLHRFYYEYTHTRALGPRILARKRKKLL